MRAWRLVPPQIPPPPPFGKGGKWYALNDVRKCLNDLDHDCCKGQTFRSPPAKPEVYRDELLLNSG